ncbi:MAG TPA: hypothetical protein DEQ61_10525 [Streptomyces sp.]|nr:hypothetical protein [Streptomyces sp.]
MKRINLRDVPDETYKRLVDCAEANRQSLNAFVVDRLEEVTKTANLTAYLALYEPPAGTGISVEDAVAALHAGRREEE